MPDVASRAKRRTLSVGLAALAGFCLFLVLTGFSPERWVDNEDLKATSWLWRLSVSAADTSLVLLIVALLIGPINVLRGGQPRVHVPLRRTVGVWAGGFAIGHVSLAVFVHAGFPRIWSNWVELTPPGLTTGRRGLANWLGLALLALVIALLWLSRDAALRRLGRSKWKLLQRSTYVLAGLVAIHAILYQSVEQRIAAHATPVRIGLFAVLAIQLVGFIVVSGRARSAPSPPPAADR